MTPRNIPKYFEVPLYITLLFLSTCCNSIKWHLEPQPDDVDGGGYDEPRPDDGHTCLRECERGELARICYYRFLLEEHSVLSSECGNCPEPMSDCFTHGCVTADVNTQTILTVNRRLPGPSIQVCKGDTVLVEVINNIPDTNVTIHWHGVKHLGAPGTPWMDGVPFVTQCPIPYNQTFEYHFVPGEAGTFLWHSYDGKQQLQGLVGSLIVREPYSSTDSLRLLYDHDLPSHIILVQDWVHDFKIDNHIETILKYLIKQTNQDEVPDSYLINGRGIELTTASPKQVPITEFYIRHGFRYRFRVIGGTSLTCPFRLTIQGHPMLVISADTNVIKPVLVESLIVASGERYDVVLNATQPVGSYWVLVEGVGECETASQVALLRYDGYTIDNLTLPLNIARGLPKAENRYTLNPVAGECSEATLLDGICASQLMSPLPTHLRLSRQPDLRFLVSLDPRDSEREFGPYSSLLLTHEMPNNTTRIHVPLNAVFEILMINTRTLNMSLSCHIHGHDFYIVEQGRLPDPLLSDNLLDLQLSLADKRFVSRLMPAKDTIAVSDGGYSLVRILADNPGLWPLRCRTDPESSVMVHVGRVSDVPPPPEDFPACQGFRPYAEDFLTM